MTDEYRAFLESRNGKRPDCPEEMPRWHPGRTETKPETAQNCGIDSGGFLSHHGVKGQKWGVRRYQDENGRLLNSAKKGKKNKQPVRESTEDADEYENDDQFDSKTLSYKAKAQRLSDEELARRNKRMQMEAQYEQLRRQIQPKSKEERRKEVMRQIFVATATVAAAALVTAAYKKAANWMILKATHGKLDLLGGDKKKNNSK